MPDHELFLAIAAIWITLAFVVYVLIRILHLWHRLIDRLDRL